MLLLILFILPGLACAGRQPKADRTVKLLTSYFSKYGKKFPDSFYGRSKVVSVRMVDIQELHKGYLHALADITLEDKSHQLVRVALEKKLPVGWKVVAWEQMPTKGLAAPASQ